MSQPASRPDRKIQSDTATTDRIERSVVIRAPRSRVWRALTDAAEFGSWFGVRVEGAFAPGRRMTGKILHKGYEHLEWKITIEKMEPEAVFSWRWHPYAIEPSANYSGEEPTLVEFTLEDVPEGTRLSVVESGFDKVPLARRALAYKMNSGGWDYQVGSIERYVMAHA